MENFCLYWNLICKTRYPKMFSNKDMPFLWIIWKWKEKMDKNNLTFWSGDLNPRFSVIFPPMIWIFMWSEEPKIKSKQASKRDRSLYVYKFCKLFYWICLFKITIFNFYSWKPPNCRDTFAIVGGSIINTPRHLPIHT